MSFSGCQTVPQKIEKRCVIPQEPVYKKIKRNMCTVEKFSVLLKNLTLQKAYISKLKSTIDCLDNTGGMIKKALKVKKDVDKKLRKKRQNKK